MFFIFFQHASKIFYEHGWTSILPALKHTTNPAFYCKVLRSFNSALVPLKKRNCWILRTSMYPSSPVFLFESTPFAWSVCAKDGVCVGDLHIVALTWVCLCSPLRPRRSPHIPQKNIAVRHKEFPSKFLPAAAKVQWKFASSNTKFRAWIYKYHC